MSEAAGTSPIRLSQELTIFHDVAKALTSSLNLDSILQTIMEKMAEYFRPDTWSLLMVDEEKDELYFAIAVGAAAEVLSKARLKVGEGIAGWVAKHGQALIVPDVQNDTRFSSRLDEMTRLQTRSVICVPLRSKHRVLGVIQLVNANDPFLMAAFDLYRDNANWDELYDTLQRVTQTRRGSIDSETTEDEINFQQSQERRQYGNALDEDGAVSNRDLSTYRNLFEALVSQLRSEDAITAAEMSILTSLFENNSATIVQIFEAFEQDSNTDELKDSLLDLAQAI